MKRYDDDNDNLELTPRVGLMDAQVARLHDGRGGSPGHRPGFACSDAVFNRDARESAYSDYEHDVTTAWKRDAREPGSIATQEGDLCTCRSPEYPDDFGSPGHVRWRNGRLTCVPDQPSTRDATTIDEAYAEYCRELRSS
jgi:hypothetical protein